MDGFTVPLMDLVNEMKLEIVSETDNINEIKISSVDVLRPGLQLASGFYGYFDNQRILIFGRMENAYLDMIEPSARLATLIKLFEKKVPAVVSTRGQEILPEVLETAKKYNIPILRTELDTSPFMAGLIASLNIHLAPRITRHGVLVEVYGEGILMIGDSGVGKSETAIELVKRGHRLVADDAVEIKRVSSKTLVGSAPAIIRHFIELRGIGIVDVQKIFGMGAVKDTEKIDFVINLETWEDGKQYDRLGLDGEFTELLGVRVPSTTVPVRPGRNLAVIVEVAAMNNRQKKMGYNAAEALNQRLIGEGRII